MDRRTAILGTGNTIVVAAAEEDTGGAFSLLDYELAPGFASLPPHIHAREHEAVYSTRGPAARLLGEREHVFRPGDFVFLPKGTPHALSNPSPDPARFLILLIPAGFEQIFAELEKLIETGAGLGSEHVAAVLALYGVTVVAGDRAVPPCIFPLRRSAGS